MSLDTELNFYKENKESFVGKYEGRFIVIVGNEVVGDFENFQDAAYHCKEKKYKQGDFLIKQVKEKEDPVFFRTRVHVGDG